MKIQPYLFLNGRCEEAAKFYGEALGAKVEMMSRFNEMPEAEGCPVPPGYENKVMHMSLCIGESTILASDGMGESEEKIQGVSLTLLMPNPAEAERVFNLLADGGNIQMPLAPTFFSASFGMLEDRFGVSWMIYVDKE